LTPEVSKACSSELTILYIPYTSSRLLPTTFSLLDVGRVSLARRHAPEYAYPYPSCRPPRWSKNPGSEAHTSTGNTQSHSRSPGTQSPARLSRNSTSTALKEKGRGKDRETNEPENADRPADITATSAGPTSENASDIDVARQASPPAHTPGASSAIDPLSQVSLPLRPRVVTAN
jgi:hypothetical protein